MSIHLASRAVSPQNGSAFPASAGPAAKSRVGVKMGRWLCQSPARPARLGKAVSCSSISLCPCCSVLFWPPCWGCGGGRKGTCCGPEGRSCLELLPGQGKATPTPSQPDGAPACACAAGRPREPSPRCVREVAWQAVAGNGWKILLALGGLTLFGFQFSV